MKQTTMTHSQNVTRKWIIIDAKNMVLGRLSTKVANLLRGKDLPTYTPSEDLGAAVIVINCAAVQLTGRKLDREFRYNHSGWRGGLRQRSVREMRDKYADELVYRSVKGMLPKNHLSSRILKHLFLYKNADHKHAAQNPVSVEI